MDCLYIVVPAYNEEPNLRNFVDDWYPVVERHNPEGTSRLVILDDGSTDDTCRLLREMARTRPLLVPLTKENEGHGPTVIRGYRYALKHQADYIFQTDSDGQTDPDEFENFWSQRKDYTALFGNRVARGDGKAREFSEKVLCFILRLIFRVAIPDSNAPFRLMSRRFLKKYIRKLPRKYFLPNVMLTTFGVYYHEPVKFIPISFRPRQGGTNSINMKKMVRIGIRSVREFLWFRRNRM